MVNETTLYTPWIIMYKLFKALFGDDPEIKVEYNDTDPCLKLFVSNEEKADALAKLLPPSYDFGNVSLGVIVVPPNSNATDRTELFKKAFAGNPAFKDSVALEEFGGKFIYNIFTKKVVQYTADDIGDFYGVESTLYEDIARDVFGDIPGVFYCTDVDEEPIK